MVRLHLFAEGQTEQTFASTVLTPHLANFGVYLNKPVLIAHARKKGKTHRGGGRKYEPMKNDILRLMAQDKKPDVFFTTMIDLYAIHSDFPGLDDAAKLQADPYKRVEFLENAWKADVSDDRFIPFIQLHEFEAYLLAGVEEFSRFYIDAAKQISTLQKIVDSRESPELIDDGQHSAPSKRIVGEFPDYKGAKASYGPQIAQRIGVKRIRSKCPHFDRWITGLENLGKEIAA